MTGLQARFFASLGVAQPFRHLFDYLTDVDCFAKDVEGRFVAMSAGTIKRIGYTTEAEVIGLDDYAIHPPAVAKSIRDDDLEVMRTRHPLIDRVEALYSSTRARDWFLTTKLPIINARGAVVGVMGFVRPYHGGVAGAPGDAPLQRVVEHIQQHHSERLVVAELAKIARCSTRHLNRRFQETFRMSAQEFILRTRIQSACEELLRTDRQIIEIAISHGFYDQSAFTRYFRRLLGETPMMYRRRRR